MQNHTQLIQRLLDPHGAEFSTEELFRLDDDPHTRELRRDLQYGAVIMLRLAEQALIAVPVTLDHGLKSRVRRDLRARLEQRGALDALAEFLSRGGAKPLRLAAAAALLLCALALATLLVPRRPPQGRLLLAGGDVVLHQHGRYQDYQGRPLDFRTPATISSNYKQCWAMARLENAAELVLRGSSSVSVQSVAELKLNHGAFWLWQRLNAEKITIKTYDFTLTLSGAAVAGVSEAEEGQVLLEVVQGRVTVTIGRTADSGRTADGQTPDSQENKLVIAAGQQILLTGSADDRVQNRPAGTTLPDWVSRIIHDSGNNHP